MLLSAASSKDMVLKLEPFGIFQEVYSQEGTWEVKTDVGSVPFGLLVEISLNWSKEDCMHTWKKKILPVHDCPVTPVEDWSTWVASCQTRFFMSGWEIKRTENRKRWHSNVLLLSDSKIYLSLCFLVSKGFWNFTFTENIVFNLELTNSQVNKKMQRRILAKTYYPPGMSAATCSLLLFSNLCRASWE